MKKKLISQIGASAILLTSLIGTSPASADLPVLPPNANGIDNSGITAILCEDSAHFRLPVPVNTDPNALVPGSGLYEFYDWWFYLGEEYIRNTYPSYREFDNGDFTYRLPLDGIDVSNGVTLTLKGVANYFAEDSFDLDLEPLEVEFAGGTGTATDPYLVSNAEQLNMLRCVNNKHFALTDDIDLAGIDWLPIYGTSGSWQGALDGRGHEIKNLSVSGLQKEAALFG
ncbi:MAG: hypothetical protein RL038_710, partial [Actinomycetota bacterium]